MPQKINMQTEYAVNYVSRRVAAGDGVVNSCIIAAKLFGSNYGSIQVKYHKRKRGIFPKALKAKLDK
jgi:hypothetical protein